MHTNIYNVMLCSSIQINKTMRFVCVWVSSIICFKVLSLCVCVCVGRVKGTGIVNGEKSNIKICFPFFSSSFYWDMFCWNFSAIVYDRVAINRVFLLAIYVSLSVFIVGTFIAQRSIFISFSLDLMKIDLIKDIFFVLWNWSRYCSVGGMASIGIINIIQYVLDWIE